MTRSQYGGSTRRQRPSTRSRSRRRPATRPRPVRPPLAFLSFGVLGLVIVGVIAWWMLSAEKSGGVPQASCAVVLDFSSSDDGGTDLLRPAALRAFDQCAEAHGVIALFTLDRETGRHRLAGRWELYPDVEPRLPRSRSGSTRWA